MLRIRSPIVFMAIVAVLTLTLAAPGVFAAPLPGGTLDPTTIDQYAIPLVIPPVINDSNPKNRRQDKYDIAVREFKQQILPGGIWNVLGFTTQTFDPTTVWSYGPAADPSPGGVLGLPAGVAPAPNSQFNYPAYTFETISNKQVDVRWINDLRENFGKGPGFLSHLLPIDRTLHWANPEKDCRMGDPRTDCSGGNPDFYTGPVPIVTHVHGAHVDPHSDGYPEAWWLPAANGDFTPCSSLLDTTPGCYVTEGTLFDDANGHARFSNLGYADYSYRQDQPATTLWYHDHSLGMTRSNVYAGPAGFWLIRGGEYDRVFRKVGKYKIRGLLPGPAPRAGDTVLELNAPGVDGAKDVRSHIREIPVVIQDRSFNEDGSLFYPDNRAFFEGLNPEGAGPPELQIDFVPDSDIAPIWNPEAFFNTMVVNGVAWPTLDVAPALYRFRLLNGCNSRFLWLKFSHPNVEVYQIGAEQGFLPGPVLMNGLDLDQSGDGKAQLLMALAERADVIVDFRWLPDGTTVELLNIGPDEPFGGGIPGVDFDPADPATTGKVMQFVVNYKLLKLRDFLTTPPDKLVLNAETGLTGPYAATRTLSLNEGSSEEVCVEEDVNGNLVQVEGSTPPECSGGGEPFGPKEALLGIVDAGGNPVPLKWTDTTISTPVPVKLANGSVLNVNVTENPTVGSQEVWELYNVTADAHPIHLHLVRFQVIDRQGLALDADGEVVVPISLGGVPRGPEPWEMGFKDTVISYPGEVTRVKALFDIEGLYVWHCHIVEHEDNEMMRPFVVSAAP